MPLITLISDWHQGDYYLPAIKGKLYSLVPNLTLIDITHGIKSFKSTQAAFIIRNSYKTFPPQTVHFICINTLMSSQVPYIAIYHKEQYFIGVDDGIFSLIFNDKVDKAVTINYSNYTTFPEYDILAEAAAFLANGGDIMKLGEPYPNLREIKPFEPNCRGNIINGKIIYVDSYGNLISNITKSFFYQKVKDNPFEIMLDWGYYKVNSISKGYDYHENISSKNNIIALFNSLGLLEIALIGGSASSILKVDENSEVTIKILTEKETQTPPPLKLL